MKKRCAIYVRTTGIEQDGSQQRSELREFAKNRGLEITEVYADKGVGAVRDREGISQLLLDAKAGEFDFVLVQTIDRLFCSSKHMMAVIEELHPRGIGLISVRDEIETLSENGGVINHLLQRFSRFNEVIISERIMAGHMKAIEKHGGYFGGYFGGHKKVDRAKVRKLLAKGICQKEVARRLKIGAASVSRVAQEIKKEKEAAVALDKAGVL